jgi:hypothetical protein
MFPPLERSPICGCCKLPIDACQRGTYRSPARENALSNIIDAPATGAVSGSVDLSAFVDGMTRRRGR